MKQREAHENASKPDPDPVFYICEGKNFCIGSGVKREPRPCPNCGVACVAVDRWGKQIEVSP